MLDLLAKYFRFPVAFVLSFVVSAVFFLAIPVINALMSDKGVKGQKELEAVTEVEVLVSEKKPEVKQKVIRTIVNPTPFKSTSNMGVSRSQNFQMDLSLARGAAGDGGAELPERDHRREVERGDAGDDARSVGIPQSALDTILLKERRVDRIALDEPLDQGLARFWSDLWKRCDHFRSNSTFWEAI